MEKINTSSIIQNKTRANRIRYEFSQCSRSIAEIFLESSVLQMFAKAHSAIRHDATAAQVTLKLSRCACIYVYTRAHKVQCVRDRESEPRLEPTAHLEDCQCTDRSASPSHSLRKLLYNSGSQVELFPPRLPNIEK